MMQRRRHVKTRGCLTSDDIHVLLLLAVSRALPFPGCGPVSKGTACELWGLPREDRPPGMACEVGNHNITHRGVLEAISQVTL